MGYGITCLQITTNPVELWAAPNSRSRKEKDLFDSNFGPFYRIEQIIIKSKCSSFNKSIDDRQIEFGPAFNQTFLLDVLNLQKGIESMSNLFHYLRQKNN